MAKQTTSTPETRAAKAPATPAARKAPASSGSRPVLARRIQTPSITTFFRESSFELLHRVTRPTRQETMNLTVAVIVMTVSIALFLGLWDALLDAVVKGLIGA